MAQIPDAESLTAAMRLPVRSRTPMTSMVIIAAAATAPCSAS
jgi:hypothetical protein